MNIELIIPSDPGPAILSQREILQQAESLGVRVQPRRALADRSRAGHHDLGATLIVLANLGAGAAVIGGIFGLFNVVLAEYFRRCNSKAESPQIIVLKVGNTTHELAGC